MIKNFKKKLMKFFKTIKEIYQLKFYFSKMINYLINSKIESNLLRSIMMELKKYRKKRKWYMNLRKRRSLGLLRNLILNSTGRSFRSTVLLCWLLFLVLKKLIRFASSLEWCKNDFYINKSVLVIIYWMEIKLIKFFLYLYFL